MKHNLRFRVPALCASAIVALAVACGGGGDDSSSATGNDAGGDTSVSTGEPSTTADATFTDTAAPVSGEDAALDTSSPGHPDATPPNFAPAPHLTSILPTQAILGASGPTVVCTGTGFVARSVVQVDGVALATSFVSDTELRATLPDGKLAQTGPLALTVGTAPPGGGGSAEVDFQVVNPAPAVTSLAPTNVPVGAIATNLTVTGTSLQSGSTISFGGAPLPTTFVSATSLTTQIPAAQLLTAGSFPVVVTNPAPGGGASTSIAFIVTNPTVTLGSVAPSTITYGSAATPLALTGTGFVGASSVELNGTIIPSTFTDSSHLAATAPPNLLLTAGNFPVVVSNPVPGGGLSAPITVHVVYPQPVAASVTPSSILVGSPPPTLAITGSGFIAGVSTMAFNGVNAQTLVTDATHASATLTTQQVAVAQSILVTVTNPAPGGGTSSPVTFAVDNVSPVATGVTPSSAIVGAGDTPITVAGTGFVSTSSVLLGTTALATTFVDAQTLKATIPAASMTSAVTLSLAVSTPAPGGGSSQPLSFVVDNPGPTIGSIAPPSTLIPASDTPITLSGTGFVSGVSSVVLNGVPVATTYGSGTLGATIPSASLQSATTLSITVVNPSPGGGSSNVAFFTASDPLPILSAVTPSQITYGAAATPLTLAGSGFVAASTVQANGTTIASTFDDAGALSATLPASLIGLGSITITVTNPAPGGGTSGGKTITVACDATGVDVSLSALTTPTTIPLSLTTSTTSAERITKSGSGYKCPSSADTSSPLLTEPYQTYLVLNDTGSQATLDAWAVCGSTDDGFLAFYATATKPTTQAALEQCATVVSEGAWGAGPTSAGYPSPQSGSSHYCPGLTKSNGGGLTLAACAKAVVIVQPWSTDTSTYPGYTPPTSLQVQIE